MLSICRARRSGQMVCVVYCVQCISIHERPEVAEAEVHRWFSVVYRNPNLTSAAGVSGTPEQVREQLEALIAVGANHLLLNPVTRYTEQVEALAEVVGLA
jgi:alkanesulfonate monooxygenase SsuD/methylene tetrahydromethanopterin reductase-like flavin-dependent oxidoreductase (luciferase family)